jgi:hypothetical protein
MTTFFTDWQKAFRSREYRDQFLVTLAALVVTIILMRSFMGFIGARMGAVLRDPVIELFRPASVPWVMFSLIYAGFLLGLVSLSVRPFSVLLALRALVVLIVLRALCQYFLPLDPPADAIPLADPFINVPGFRHVIVRDLFFSWHTALLALLAFATAWRDLKVILGVLAFIVSGLMLLQHAHYMIDLIAAPCFAYVAYGLAKAVTVSEVKTVVAGGAKQPRTSVRP